MVLSWHPLAARPYRDILVDPHCRCAAHFIGDVDVDIQRSTAGDMTDSEQVLVDCVVRVEIDLAQGFLLAANGLSRGREQG